MRIERQQTEGAFATFAQRGSGVVIGAPGSGKSYLLRGFAQAQLEEPSAYSLFIPVDRLPEISEASLSADLGVEGDLFDFLEIEAADSASAYFIIDALDAARSDRGRAAVLNLVRRAHRQLLPKWRVIVSVRTYDALRSNELEEIFSSAGSVGPDEPAEFRLHGVVCRHFFVPPLTDEEIVSATEIPGLPDIWARATPELQSILRTPFCLWLLDRIVAGGGEEGIRGLRSEVELLGLFWRLRVDAGSLAVDRRLILERVTNAMLAARALSAPTSSVYVSSEHEAWHELHSSEVLTSTTTGPLRTVFSHNILFDYAVSVLSLDTAGSGPRAFLEEEPSRALFLRPSLNYFFLRLWHHDRPGFWEMLFSISQSERSQVRLFTRVLPPTVVATEARAVTDLNPLIARLNEDVAAPEIVLRVLQSLRFAGVPRPEVWAPICESFAHRAVTDFVWELALVLDRLAQVDVDADLRGSVGSSARTLLDWAFAQRADNPLADRLGSVWLVPLVAKTIDTDLNASSDLLMRVVQGIGNEAVSVDYAYRLADQLDRVWGPSPELAALLFQRSFSHFETSEERTQMGGIVVALTSTRRQDFDMVQFVLKRHAPAFLHDQPAHAIPAIVESINAQVRLRELARRGTEPPTASFSFNGVEATYVRDGSHFWDAGGAVHGDQHELMDVLVRYLDEFAEADALDALRDGLNRVGAHAEVAFVWRRLLIVATRRPEKYVSLLRELLLAPPILTGLETVREAAEFLSAALPYLSAGSCLEIENTVVRLAAAEEDVTDAPIGRLIQRFPDERLQTPEGRELKEVTKENINAQTNRPLVEFQFSSEPFTEEMWLTEQGVNVEDPTVTRLSELAAPIAAFEAQYRNAAPTEDSVTAVLADIERALDELESAEGIPDAVDDSMWAKLGEAAVVLVRNRETLTPSQLDAVRQVLLSCAYGRGPSAETAGDFTFPAWSPDARNEAAQGLPLLEPTPDDEATISAIRALAGDPVPSVRYLLAAELWRTCDSTPDLFWDLANRYLASETNAAVLDAVARSLGVVATVDRQPQVEQALRVLLARDDFAVGEQRRFKPEDHLSSLLVGLAIGRGSTWAQEVIRAPLANLPARAVEANGYAWFVLEFLHVDRVDIPDFQPSLQRALDWLTEAVTHAAVAIRVSHTLESPSDTVKETFDIVDEVVTRLYFNSGVYERSDRPAPAQRDVCAFFDLTRDLLGVVAEQVGGEYGTGLPASTAHHFVELLRGVVRCDPVAVTHLARQVVAAAAGAGYAFDSLASREVTELVEELLADHREVLRDGQPLDDLMFLLDTFVAAGWPEAQHIVFRLEQIFR